MYIEIKDLEEPDDIKRLEDIQRMVWKGEDIVVPAHIFIAAKEVGGILKGAYVDDKLIGFVFGFLGIFRGTKCIYSHQLAVLDEYQNLGVGSLLKLKQREDALKKGFKLIVWTYDPLRSKNAMLNINKLGSITRTYLPNHYGEMRDELNRGVPSDRFMVEWWIDSRWYYERTRYRYIEDCDFKPDLALIALKRENDLIPKKVNDELGDIVGVEIPRDIDKVGKNVREIKNIWRIKTREVFTSLFNRGYVVIRYMLYRDNKDKGIYILKRGFDPNNPDTWI